MRNRIRRLGESNVLKVIAVLVVLLVIPTLLYMHSKWNNKQMQSPAQSTDPSVTMDDFAAPPSNQGDVLGNAITPEPETEATTTEAVDPIETTEAPAQNPSETEPEEVDTVEYVDLIAVGDNLYHLSITNAGKQPDGTYNYDSIYENIKGFISEFDIKVINQEIPLTDDPTKWQGFPVFGGPIQAVDAIADAGFNVVTHATNHSMDQGKDTALNELEYWKTKEDVIVSGMYTSQEDYDNIDIGEYKGVKVAFLNYTYGLNGYSVPKDAPYLVKTLNIDRVTEDIAKAKELADIVIVFPHWGEEYITTPNAYQKDMAKKIAEAGADAIIGCHPHVIQPLEILTTSEGKEVPCFYSLGNFISNMPRGERCVECMAHLRIKKDGDDVSIDYVEAIPMVNYYTPNFTDYTVYMLSDYSDEIAKTHRNTDVTPRYVEAFFNNVFTLRYYEMGSAED